MLPEFESVKQLNPVAAGRQVVLTGSGSLPDTLPLQALVGAVLSASTTYYFALPVIGAGAIDVVLSFSALGAGVPTASIYKTLADGVTEKMGSAGASVAVAFAAAFAANVQQTASITNLRGEKIVILKIVTGANTATVGTAEYSAL